MLFILASWANVVDPGQDDALEQVRDAAGGEGAAVAIDLVGADATTALAASALAAQGLFMLAGPVRGSVPFSSSACK